MAIRDGILDMLEKHRGKNVSGEKLAETLGVSRNAVWKGINTLRNDGYLIGAHPKRGYCLLEDNKKLSEHAILKHLGDTGFYRLLLMDSVTSTNSVLKRLAESSEPEGLVVIANEQIAGRGRMGRSFYSPPGSGLYFSILLRPKISASDALLITAAAAVAVARAIEETTGTQAFIKWVNDVYCGGKKVCGILTEASTDFESGGVSYAVLGIGINLHTPENGFPEELTSVAGSVLKEAPYSSETKARLIASTLSKFLEFYEALPQKHFMDVYRRRSCVIGKEIYVISGDSREEALALDIGEDASLIVKIRNGEIKRLNSGEVSIREKL